MKNKKEIKKRLKIYKAYEEGTQIRAFNPDTFQSIYFHKTDEPYTFDFENWRYEVSPRYELKGSGKPIILDNGEHTQIKRCLMKRPDKNIPPTVKGSYIRLEDNMSFDWERYAKDLDIYIDKKFREVFEAIDDLDDGNCNAENHFYYGALEEVREKLRYVLRKDTMA